jgi:WD40 repeat protein
VCQKHGVFVVDNATDGFTLYRLEGKGEPVRTFVTALPSLSVPKQVAFGEEGKVVVGGSDTGLAYIFDRKTGQVLETLHHADAGLVQTIAVSIEIGHKICHSTDFQTRDLDGRCTIACASPALGRGNTTIKIWACDYAAQKVSKTPSQNHWSISRALMILMQILAVLSMSMFLVNYKDLFFVS